MIKNLYLYGSIIILIFVSIIIRVIYELYNIENYENYIIGPSHIHNSCTHLINNEINNKTLFNDCILDGYCGIPIWSKHIYNSLNDNDNANKIII